MTGETARPLATDVVHCTRRPPVEPADFLHVTAEGPAASLDSTGSPKKGARAAAGVAKILALVADRTRLKILRTLATGERAVGSLTVEFRIPQSTVSHHLAWLRQVSLVTPRRQGKNIFYSLGVAAHCDSGGALTLAADDATVTITPRVRST